MARKFYSPLMDDTDVAKLIASRLTKIRKIEQLTQKQLSERAYISISTIKRFELNGECTFLNLIKIARALNFLDDFDKLFRYQDKYLASYSYDAEQKMMQQANKKRIKKSKTIPNEW